MNALIRKDVKCQWGQEQQKAFNELKKIFPMKPVLAALDLNKEFRVEACKGTALFPPLNCIMILWSNLSLFKYYSSNT